jgi:hypothetical protein
MSLSMFSEHIHPSWRRGGERTRTQNVFDVIKISPCACTPSIKFAGRYMYWAANTFEYDCIMPVLIHSSCFNASKRENGFEVV